MTFQSDPQVVQIAEAYSLDAVDLASRNFGMTLDWSEESIRKVEQILGRLHDELARTRPPEDTVWTFAKAFGSYICEVMRQNHGGEWGTITSDGQSFPGLQQSNGGLIWPWSRAHKRITIGSEENVWHYYSLSIGGDGSTASTTSAPPGSPGATVSKKPWWKLW
jgi:hypothetical protein